MSTKHIATNVAQRCVNIPYNQKIDLSLCHWTASKLPCPQSGNVLYQLWQERQHMGRGRLHLGQTQISASFLITPSFPLNFKHFFQVALKELRGIFMEDSDFTEVGVV